MGAFNHDEFGELLAVLLDKDYGCSFWDDGKDYEALTTKPNINFKLYVTNVITI